MAGQVVNGRAQSAAVAPLAASAPRQIPEATVARLATYLRVLTADAGRTVVSSTELAALAGVKPAGLRKDLSYLGSYGRRGVGYEVRTLVDQLRRALGAHQAYRVALVGVGNLGQALAGYAGFAGRGFKVAALLDTDPAKVGRTVGELTVRDVADVEAVCRAEAITIAMIAVPEQAAQQVVDQLVRAGIRSILNFAPGFLTVPSGVELRRVDLALELQILAFLQANAADIGEGKP